MDGGELRVRHEPDAELAGFLALAPAGPGPRLLHPGSADPRDGTDVAVRAFARLRRGSLTVLLAQPDPQLAERLQRLAAREAGHAVDLQIAVGAWSPLAVARADAVLLPMRALRDARRLRTALASARPVIATRAASTARLLAAPGVCLPVGGAVVHCGGAAHVEPDVRSVVRQLERAIDDPTVAAIAQRARAHVALPNGNGRPAPAPRDSRPVVVLEAPLFEVSSAAELTLHTARALRARGRVDLFLVPRAPLRKDRAWLLARAPELEPLLAESPPPADLWLTAGWPPRADRPPARCWVHRFDWEWGALPVELAPLLVHEVDRVVVHSTYVRRMLAAAGRPVARIDLVPHGVDATVFHDNAPPLDSVLAFKGDRPAVLFVGGLIWRKGFDLWLGALLEPAARGRVRLVVKAVGGGDAYAGFHLRDLVERARARLPDAILLIEDDLQPAAMGSLYAACDLLVHPYRGEGFGMPVLEARACGLPVVVTAGGSTDDFCRGAGCVPIAAARRAVELPDPHLSTPWVLEPDRAALANAIDAALRDLPALRAQARAASRSVRAAHTWSAAAARIERLAGAAVAARDTRAPAVAGCDTGGLAS
jgi:glycosyltransferase involved in cell wall biosynthesis